MHDIDDLSELLKDLESKLTNEFEVCRWKKKEIRFIEDRIIEYKEQIFQLKENLRILKLSKDFNSLIDMGREDEILLFKKKLQSIK